MLSVSDNSILTKLLLLWTFSDVFHPEILLLLQLQLLQSFIFSS